MHFCRVKAHGTRHNWAEKLSYFVRLLLSICLQASCFPSAIAALVLSFTSRKLAKVQKRLLASHYYTTPFFSFFALFLSPSSESWVWRRQIQFLPSFFSYLCGSKHLHIIDIFMECQDRAYITLQKAQRQSRKFLYINLNGINWTSVSG